MGGCVDGEPRAATSHTEAALLAAEQAIAVPSYFRDWSSMLAEAPPVRIVVMNPYNGPDTSQSSTYVTLVQNAHAAGALVLGYVYTSYGTRSASAVQTDIDRYYTWYPVDGIFFDETDNNNCTLEGSYYNPLYNYVKGKDADAIVALNPGAATASCYLDSADIIVTFEGLYSTYASSFSTSGRDWETPANASRIWHIVHTTQTESDMHQALTLSRQRNAGYVYVGIDTYSALPPYWSAEADDVTAWNASLGGSLTWLRASNNASTNTYRFEFSGTYAYHRVYLDTDESAASGFVRCGLGANYLIENSTLWRYTGTGSSWSWTSLGPVTRTIGPASATWSVARSALGETAAPNGADVCFEVETASNVRTTSGKYHHAYSDETGPIHAYFAENDGSSIRYQATFDVSYAQKHVFIDTDSSSATGYTTGGVGADYMIENGSVYRYTGTGSTWSWTSLGTSNMTPSTTGATGTTTWTIARSTLGETATSGETSRLVFHGRTSSGTTQYFAPPYLHVFSN
jgi:hypothetical protein